MLIRIAQSLHVGDAKFDVAEVPARRFLPSDFQRAFGQIDADDLAGRPDLAGGGEGRCAGAATDVEDAGSRAERKPIDSVFPIPVPETRGASSKWSEAAL